MYNYQEGMKDVALDIDPKDLQHFAWRLQEGRQDDQIYANLSPESRHQGML